MSVMNPNGRIALAGVDLAWQSEKNPSAIAYGLLNGGVLKVDAIDPAVFGIDDVFSKLVEANLHGIAIDAPLIINNAQGQRPCETGIGKEYGSRHAACHTSNTKLYPNARSVYLSKKLDQAGFAHLEGDHWQIECYPHPAIIEIFGLKERLKYKKGKVQERKEGQKMLAQLVLSLKDSKLLKLTVGDDSAKVFDVARIESLRGRKLKSNEDALDAIVCLYIAGLYQISAVGQLFGDDQSGYMWVPQCP